MGSEATKALGERLRAERIKLGRKQSEMSRAMGMSDVTYRSYESGRSMPAASIFNRLKDAGVDGMYVLTGERTQDQVDRAINWPLMLELAGQLEAVVAEGVPHVGQAERANYFRLAYYRAADTPGCTADEAIKFVLGHLPRA